ncbi:MAG: hypothetical protein JJU20_02140 [Opitutales bacterium]|nr:hypothetical protein [Opitutales bacterium]
MTNESSWIQTWSSERAAGSPNLRLQWEHALKQLAACGLSQEAGRSLFDDAASPSALAAICHCLQREEAAQQSVCLENLYKAVDDYAFSIQDWLESFVPMHQWLKANGKRARFDDALGFIECSASMAETTHRTATFQQITESMLAEHGFDAAE